jgi:hypothetical protein
MSRRERRRAHRERIRRNMDEFIPLPRHPYRDSAIFYGILSACLVGIATITGAGTVRGLIVGAVFFVIATGFSWWRFREKLRQREAEQ